MSRDSAVAVSFVFFFVAVAVAVTRDVRPGSGHEPNLRCGLFGAEVLLHER